MQLKKIAFAFILCAPTLSFADFNVPFSMESFIQLGQHYSTDGGVQYVASCDDGSRKSKVIAQDSEPFANTGVTVDGDHVKITFSAYSKFRKVTSTNPAKDLSKQKGDACKDSYVSAEVLGAGVFIQDTFITSDAASAPRLAAILKTYHNLYDYQGFSATSADSSISIRGRGIGYGGTLSAEQRQQLNDAIFGKGGKSVAQVADEVAKTLDQNFPAERVAKLVSSAPVGENADFGQVLYYTVSPIKK
jgi:hypothetical protein